MPTTYGEPSRGGHYGAPRSYCHIGLLLYTTWGFTHHYADGSNSPRLYRFGTEALGRCEYVMLTNKQYAAVLVVDVDQVETAGGDPADLNPRIRGGASPGYGCDHTKPGRTGF